MHIGMTLEGSLQEVWRLLAAGVADPRSPFRTLSLATVSADGTPDQRQVILREVERDARRIALHTDERSAKYSQIVRNPAVSLLGWDGEGRLQVRLNGRASLHTGDSVAQAAWDELPMASRQLYRGRQLPGTPLAEPLPDQFSQNPDEIAFKAFAVIAVVIDRIETLRLTDRGHIRARFEWLGNQPATATWLVP